MFTPGSIDEAIESFENSFRSSIAGNDFSAAVSEDELRKPFVGKDEVGAREVVKGVYNRAVASLPDEVGGVPRLRLDVNYRGDDSLIVVVRIRNKNLDGSYTDSVSVSVSDETKLEDLVDWFEGAFDESIRFELRKSNLAVINDVLGGVNKEAGNSFEVEFVDGGKPVEYVSDEKVVLAVNEAGLFSFDNLVLFDEKEEIDPADLEAGEEIDVQGASEYNERIDAVRANAIEQFKAENVVAFIKAFPKTDLGKTFSTIGTKRVGTLLKGSLRNSAGWLARSKKDIRVKYENDGVFGIVERKDGELEVSLSPVKLENGEPVDIDLIAATKSEAGIE